MNIENMTMADIEARMAQIATEMDAEDADIDALTEEVRKLNARKDELRKAAQKRDELRKAVAGGAGVVLDMPGNRGEQRTYDASSPEYRSAFFKDLMGAEMTQEERAAFVHTTANTAAVLPTTTLNNIWDLVSTQHSIMGDGASKSRSSWGPDFGVRAGMTLFDGNRRRERLNAKLDIENAELTRLQLEQSLRADLADLWQAFKNNQRLLDLEQQNLITAQENHYIAHERYMLGDLSGIEMREAQQSLLDAEERILVAQYNTKLCEISLRQLSGGIMHYTE